MKILIDIPQDFEKHFNLDRFKDSLSRIRCDTRYCFGDGVSGKYEIELLDMLVVAFEEADVIHSTCILEGTPIYKMNCDDIWNEAYDKRDGGELNESYGNG